LGRDKSPLLKRERNQRPLKNGRLYRQTTSADAKPTRLPLAACFRLWIPALIVEYYRILLANVDEGFRPRSVCPTDAGPGFSEERKMR